MDKRNRRIYETIFILRGTFTDDECKTAFNEVMEFLNKYEIKEIQEIGRKKLAYEVAKNQYGYYYIVDLRIFESDVKDIERYYKINSDVLKYIICKKY
jgi:ribosomal protein S6